MFRHKLLDQEEVLKKCALKLKIKKGRWWKVDEDSKGSNSKRGDTVNVVEVSAADARYDQVMDIIHTGAEGHGQQDMRNDREAGSGEEGEGRVVMGGQGQGAG